MRNGVSGVLGESGATNGVATPLKDFSPWVFIRLALGEKSKDGVGLLLTINFSKHHLVIPGGRVWFGLRSGELAVKARNSKIPFKYRWPKSTFPASINVKRLVSEAETLKKDQITSSSIGVGSDGSSATTKIGFTRGKEIGTERTANVQDEFEYVIWNVTTKGSEETAYWDFEANTSESYLSGGLREQEIGKVEVISIPCSIEAVFTVFKKDIRLLEAEGIWPENIGSRKKFILQAVLRKFIAEKMRLVSQVSQIEWSSEP